MLQSRQQVKDLCDQLMQRHPEQILIDLVQDKIEELVTEDDVTPDDIGAMAYECSILLDIYNPGFEGDVKYLIELKTALNNWEADATFANKTLGLDPNE